jgi:hypothetical protein
MRWNGGSIGYRSVYLELANSLIEGTATAELVIEWNEQRGYEERRANYKSSTTDFFANTVNQL